MDSWHSPAIQAGHSVGPDLSGITESGFDQSVPVSAPDTPLLEQGMRSGVLPLVHGERRGGGGSNSSPGRRGGSSATLFRVPC